MLSTGCQGPASQPAHLHAADPASKVYAIIEAGRTKDRSSIPALVEQLESGDPLVRVMAIQALEHITGTRLGYNPYDSVVDRQPAMKRWVEAVREKRFSQTVPNR